MNWSPPRRYKGLRTAHIHAVKITLTRRQTSAMGVRERTARALAELVEMEAWCDEFCTSQWSTNSPTIWYFDQIRDALMFKLVWS